VFALRVSKDGSTFDHQAGTPGSLTDLLRPLSVALEANTPSTILARRGSDIVWTWALGSPLPSSVARASKTRVREVRRCRVWLSAPGAGHGLEGVVAGAVGA
jgi:hypothetical protein